MDYRQTLCRVFYLNYDKLENTADFEDLRDLVENIYTNEYLGKLLPHKTLELTDDFREVVYDESNDVEVFRHEVIMDLAS